MYIRNVKQLLRAADSAFDERRYGFGGLMDLLRACQRDGVMRLERDRRGGLRVFPGAALQHAVEMRAQQPVTTSQPAEPVMDVETDEGDGQPIVSSDVEPPEVNGNVIDTTAELLGRAKPRRPRAKAPAPIARKSTRAAAGAGPRKPPVRRARARKPAADTGDDNS